MNFESRREFLLNTGKVLGGAALLSAAAPLTKVVAEGAAHPYTWVKIDPEKAADNAYARLLIPRLS